MRKDLEISSDVQNLRLIEKLIDELQFELDLSDESYGNVLVATIEATNNAIVHGNKSDPSKVVLVKIEKEQNELIVNIKDQGPGFDFKSVPDPTAPVGLPLNTGH